MKIRLCVTILLLWTFGSGVFAGQKCKVSGEYWKRGWIATKHKQDTADKDTIYPIDKGKCGIYLSKLKSMCPHTGEIYTGWIVQDCKAVDGAFSTVCRNNAGALIVCASVSESDMYDFGFRHKGTNMIRGIYSEVRLLNR